jgi:hypothetical protein
LFARICFSFLKYTRTFLKNAGEKGKIHPESFDPAKSAGAGKLRTGSVEGEFFPPVTGLGRLDLNLWWFLRYCSQLDGLPVGNG